MDFKNNDLNLAINGLTKKMSFKISFISILFCFGIVPVFSQLTRFSYTQPKMGSPFNIIMYCSDSAQSAKAAAACFSLIDSLNEQLSDYLPGSELNSLNNNAGSGKWIPVSAHFLKVLQQSADAFYQSKGAFDVTIGPISKLWRKARKDNIFPDSLLIVAQLKKVNGKAVLVDAVHRTVQLKFIGMQLDMGGIAKGYTAQAVIDYLRTIHIRIALADAGGDIAVGESPPGKKGWQLGINVPESSSDVWDKRVNLVNTSIATSGDLYQFIEHNGKVYSHIIDPLTGYGVTNRRNVTIIATDGATADWLATACSVLPLKKALRLADKMKAHLFVAEWRKGSIIVSRSKAWNKYWLDE
jgi:FAD:protein FMN transferase